MHALIEDRLAEVKQLCERFPVRRLELFGSAARDDFDPTTSDVDFLVEFQPLPVGQRIKARIGLKDALEALFGRRVDLVELALVRNPYFLKGLRQPGGPTMQDRARGYLYDIQQGCDWLTQFTAGKTLADYEADRMLRLAVERQFEIIGEALKQLLKRQPRFASIISDVQQIIGFRNCLIHGYDLIDNSEVWKTLQKDVPTLRAEVEKALNEDEPSAS